MIDQSLCPICADGELTRSEGQLDQCGATFLPTSVWTCIHCGYTRYDPAPATHWKSASPAGGGTAVVVAHQSGQREAA
jgi:hypothetical protein